MGELIHQIENQKITLYKGYNVRETSKPNPKEPTESSWEPKMFVGKLRSKH